MIPLCLRRYSSLAYLYCLALAVSAQTLADRWAIRPGTKLIVVHADDLGETHAVNAAAIKASKAGRSILRA